MARVVVGLFAAASLLSVYTQAENAAEGSEAALAQASVESQRDFVKAISRLKLALQEQRIVKAQVEKRKASSVRREGTSKGRVAAFAAPTGGVALQQVAEKVESLGAVRPRPHGEAAETAKAAEESKSAQESVVANHKAKKASADASDEETAAARPPTEEQGGAGHDRLPSAEALLEEAEPNLEKCKIQGQKDPTETLATLKACTEELKKMASVTMEAHQGSENANKQYVSKFKEVMALLKKIEAVHELQSAFDKDHENVRKYLVGEANKLKKPISQLGAKAEALSQ